MRQFEITRQLFGADITARVLLLEEGLHVSVSGGELPHIGAVSVVDPAGARSCVQFPGHRDAAVSERWAASLSQAGYRPVVVEAGIHYDGLSREGIEAVLALAEELLAAVTALLAG
ncbi:MAG: hypothetical protein ACI3WR_03260 [Oscillospiraceae bacterium]